MPPESTTEQLADFDRLWEFSNPVGTEAKFRELLPIAEAAGDVSAKLQLLTQIARAQGLQRKFDAARQTLDEVEAQLDGQPERVRVRYLLERGRVHNDSKDVENARACFQEAWQLGRAAGEDNFAIDAAHMVAIVAPPEDVLEWNEKAMALAELSRDDRARRWLGALYNNIAWAYHDQGKHEQALEHFQRALAWREERGVAAPILIARWSVARTLRSLGRLDEALAMQEELLREHEQAGTKDGYVFEELAECHLARGEPEKAADYFALAYVELSQDAWLVDNEPERISRLKQLGKLKA